MSEQSALYELFRNQFSLGENAIWWNTSTPFKDIDGGAFMMFCKAMKVINELLVKVHHLEGTVSMLNGQVASQQQVLLHNAQELKGLRDVIQGHESITQAVEEMRTMVILNSAVKGTPVTSEEWRDITLGKLFAVFHTPVPPSTTDSTMEMHHDDSASVRAPAPAAAPVRRAPRKNNNNIDHGEI
jgi:hypothetical protein